MSEEELALKVRGVADMAGWDKAKTAATEVQTKVTTAQAAIKGKFDEAASAATAWRDKIQTAAKEAGSTLKAEVGAAVDAGLSKASELAGSFEEGFGRVEMAARGGSDAMNAVADQAEAMGLDAVAETARGLAGGFDKAAEMAGAASGAMVTLQTGTDLARKGMDLMGVSSKIALGPLGLLIAAVALVALAWNGNWGDIQGKTQRVVDWVKTIPSKISAVWDKVKEGLKVLKDNWQLLLLGPAGLVGLFLKLNPELVQAGKDVIAGLLKGLTDKWHTVTDFLMTKAKGLISDVMGVFGIHSPSTVFRNIGFWVMEGLAIGVRYGGKLVEEALQEQLLKIETLRASWAAARADMERQLGGRDPEQALKDIAEERANAERKFAEMQTKLEADAREQEVRQARGEIGSEHGGEYAGTMRAEAARLAEKHAHKMARLAEEEAFIRRLADTEREALADLNAEIQKAEALIREAQRAQEERENRIHTEVMRRYQAQRDARAKFYADELANLEKNHNRTLANIQEQEDAWNDHLEGMREAISDQQLALDGLKLDLDVPAQQELVTELTTQLQEVQTELEQIKAIAQSFTILETDPRAEKANAYQKQIEKVRATTDEQRKLLGKAMAEGLIPEGDRRTVELMLLGYKARATDVERIMAGIVAHYESQIQKQDEIVTVEQQRLEAQNQIIAAKEQEIAKAQHALALEEDRVQTILEGLADQRTAAEATYNARKSQIEAARDSELAGIDATMKRAEEAHARRMAQIAEYWALQLAQLGHSQEEIDALVRRAQEEAARIAAETEARYEQAMNDMGAIGRGQAGTVSAAWADAGQVIVNSSDRAAIVMEGVVTQTERWVGSLKQGEEVLKAMQRVSGITGTPPDRRPMSPSMRQQMFSGRQGSGGFRVGSDEGWRRYHYGEAPEDESGVVSVERDGITFKEGKVEKIEMGDIIVDEFIVHVKIGEDELDATIERATVGDSRWVDKAGKVIGEAVARQLPVTP